MDLVRRWCNNRADRSCREVGVGRLGTRNVHLLSTATCPGELFMPDFRVNPGEAKEDQITAAIEKYTSQVPSSVYLGLAVASIVGSLALKATKKDHEALYVGQWVAPFLLLGIYNKLVKQHGSDGSANK
jgi:hypothetical protein